MKYVDSFLYKRRMRKGNHKYQNNLSEDSENIPG